jgi:hypothetical protein
MVKGTGGRRFKIALVPAEESYDVNGEWRAIHSF